MMRKIALLAAIAALLLLPACKGKERSKLPDKRDKVTEFATVPSFKAMFLALDKLDVTDSFQSGADFTPAAEDSLHYAFVWGTLTAASQLAIRKRDSAWLTKLTDQMVANAPKLGLQDIAAKLRSTARPMLDNKDWEGLTAVYYNMQYTVEQSLFQKRKYEVYTLLALGGWSYCTQQIAGVIEKDYKTEASGALIQREAWRSISENLGFFRQQRHLASPGFKTAYGLVRDMQALMDMQAGGAFNPEQVTRIVDLTGRIQSSFIKT